MPLGVIVDGVKGGKLIALSNEKPLRLVLIFLLTAMLCIVFPTEWLSDLTNSFIAPMIIRLIFSSVGVVLMVLLGQKRDFFVSGISWRHLDLFLCAIFIILANAPFIALSLGTASIDTSASLAVSFVFFHISVSLFEEIFFRGLIITLLIKHFKQQKRKHAVLLALIMSSAIFGLVHLFNLAGNPVGAVFMQVGYAFLTGLLFAVLYLFTKSLWPAIVAHALFNIAGLIATRQGLGSGNVWPTHAIIFMIVAAVLAGVYLTWRTLRFLYGGAQNNEQQEPLELLQTEQQQESQSED